MKLFKNERKPGVRTFFTAFPWVWLVAAYLITMAILCLHGRACVDSDMASEMILADQLNKEGGLLSTVWYYSTEIRVLYLQVIYRLTLLLFPHNWYMARILGQALWMLLLIISYLYVGHGLKLRNCGVWGAAALACPFGTWYIWHGWMSGSYLPHMILVLLSFGAILHLIKISNRKYRIWHGILLLISSLGSGLNSVKGLMGFYLPMVLTSCILLGLQWHTAPQQRPQKEGRILLYSLAAMLFAIAGYLLNSTVLATTHTFSNYNNRWWSVLRIDTLINRWAEFLSLFGYPVDSLLGGSVSLFSWKGILSACSLLIIGALVFSLVRLLMRWRKLQSLQRVAPLLLFMICLVQGGVFAFTQGEDEAINASYWLTVMPFVFPVLQLEGETEHFQLRFTRRMAAVAFCLCFVATGISSMVRYLQDGYRANPQLMSVCDWLAEQGYTQGYATFWNGNVVTEWSSGAVEMWVTGDFNTMQPYEWLQKTDHAQPPEGPVFLLTTMEELNSMHLEQLYWWSNVVYEDGEEIADRTKRYIVMEYKDYNDMMAAVQGAQSWETETIEENP